MTRKHSYAAYAREDVEDAKRGHPDVSLEAWAAERGLEYMGSSLPGAFSPVLPVWKDYVFNLCRGSLAPDRYGYVAHELDEVGVGDGGKAAMPGGYHSMRVNTKVGGLKGLFRFSAYLDDKPPNEPFATRSFWLPATKVAVRVPEAALLPIVVIRSADRFPLVGNPKLDDAGLPGFRMAGNRWVDDSLRLAIGAAVSPIGSLGAAYAGVRIDRGVIGVHRNGFVAPEDLDAMVSVAVEVARGLAEIGRSMTAPQPFSSPLPPPDPATWPPGYDKPQDHEVDVFARVSAELGMEQEDPVALHQAQPSCPVPGRALGLVRGVLPNTSIEGRVGFFVQGGITSGTYRSAVMAPARAGASTPLGGTLDQSSDLYVEVADGVAYAWPRVRSIGALNAAATVAAAVPTLQRLGLI